MRAVVSKGGDHVQKHYIYRVNSRGTDFCASKYAGGRISISGLDFPYIQGVDVVWYACRWNYRRLAVNISETQAAKTERRQKVIAAK